MERSPMIGKRASPAAPTEDPVMTLNGGCNDSIGGNVSPFPTAVTAAKKERKKEEDQQTFEDDFESPFLALKPALRAFQLLGIFNFSTHSRCTAFVHRPLHFVYSLMLNLLLISVPIMLNMLWFRASDMHFDQLKENLTKHFSKTDFVALTGVGVLLQVASLGFHWTNLELGHNLNSLIANVHKLGIVKFINHDGVEERSHQNPGTKKLYGGLGMVLFMLISSQFMIGYSFPSMIGLSDSPILKLLLGIAQAMAVTYLHLPKIFCETLFLRMVHVLEFHYQHLLEHSDCCLMQKKVYKNSKRKQSITSCCLDHWTSLIQLFRAVEKTFRKQLFIQHALIMGSLLFGVYLSTSFMVTSNALGEASHALFTLGFMLYSLVPALRLLVTADSVDKVIVKIQETRFNLFEMEATQTCPERLPTIRWAIRQYQGIEGFSACNYFMVNPQLVTSIMGYLTTYIIVLMQFKITELQF